MNKHLCIGVMSGTSLDGVDVALFDFNQGTQMLCHHHETYPIELCQRLEALTLPGDDEINRLGPVDRELGQFMAGAINTLLQNNKVNSKDILAIGSHGHTIRHSPIFNGAFTLQIGDPNTIAEQTQITTVADFRRRDIAAGGEGAPLAPAFHNRVFRSNAHSRAIINIGGIANITLLNDGPVIGFDTGPGNGLMNAWIQKHKGEEYDKNGDWAATGEVNQTLLGELLSHEYFSRKPPKSTGRELFNLSMLEAAGANNIAAQDVQATLAQFTALTIGLSVPKGTDEIFICGGGAHNKHLISQIKTVVPQTTVATTEVLGVPPDWVEAAAFAWLAEQTMTGKPGNLASVSGASGERILGAIYQA